MKEVEQIWQDALDAYDAGELAYALERSRELARKFPEFQQGLFLQGTILVDLARYDEGEALLSEALRIYPPEHRHLVYYELGHARQARGDFAGAETFYRQGLAAQPGNGSGYVYLGSVLALRGDLDGAEAVHRQGIACETKAVDEAYYNLGLVLRGQERYAEARECFVAALAAAEDDDYEEAGRALADVEKAIEYLKHGARAQTE